VLNSGGIATLLVDLLTPEEEPAGLVSSDLRFDISLLADRLVAATDWARQHRYLSGVRLGYFGASTGTAAALVAAARRPDVVSAIVSRGGRPDLASRYFGKVIAPTLLIVGEFDYEVLLLNREALRKIPHVKLEIVPRATHLFEEKGALEQVAFLARGWFENKLITSR
jgi:pimeloyl-ACP methyl ester carboxylesterase